MRPQSSESRPSCLYHFGRHWIFLFEAAILDVLFNANIDDPSTIRRITQVLLDRIIVLLPTIQGPFADKTDYIVWRGCRGLIEEAGFCKLWRLGSYGLLGCPGSISTCAGAGVLWGHLRVFAPLALDDLFLVVG